MQDYKNKKIYVNASLEKISTHRAAICLISCGFRLFQTGASYSDLLLSFSVTACQKGLTTANA